MDALKKVARWTIKVKGIKNGDAPLCSGWDLESDPPAAEHCRRGCTSVWNASGRQRAWRRGMENEHIKNAMLNVQVARQGASLTTGSAMLSRAKGSGISSLLGTGPAGTASCPPQCCPQSSGWQRTHHPAHCRRERGRQPDGFSSALCGASAKPQWCTRRLPPLRLCRRAALREPSQPGRAAARKLTCEE